MEKRTNKITKKDLDRVFWRMQVLNVTNNFESMQAIGFLSSFVPVLERLYKDRPKEEKVEAMKRHLKFFNSHVNSDALILGVAAAIEENTDEDEKDVVTSVKTGLMGPLAGIGDSLFWGVWRVVCAGLAIGFANAGNILAPIIFLVLFNVPNFLCRYYGACLGYSLGAKYIEKLYANGMIEILTKAAGIVGLIMVGAMTSQTVVFKTILEFKMKGQSLMNVQSALDSIFKGIVPLLMTFGCYKLLNKKVNVIAIIFGIVALGIVLSLLGIC